MLHEEVLLDGWGGDFDVEGLVLDEDVGGVSLDALSHHLGPCLDEAVLVVGCLEAVEPQELLHHVSYLFGVSSSHGCLGVGGDVSGFHSEDFVVAL